MLHHGGWLHMLVGGMHRRLAASLLGGGAQLLPELDALRLPGDLLALPHSKCNALQRASDVDDASLQRRVKIVQEHSPSCAQETNRVLSKFTKQL